MRYVPFRVLSCSLGLLLAAHMLEADEIGQLPPLASSAPAPSTDWLIDDSPYKAGVFHTERPDELVLDNGVACPASRITPTFCPSGSNR